MNQEQILFGVASVWAVGLAVGVLSRKPRTLVVLSFSAGMLLLAADGFLELTILQASILQASNLEAVLRFERLRMIVLSALPAAWVPFCLCYSRGDSRQYLVRWKWYLLAACLLPLVPMAAFSQLLTLDPRVVELGIQPLVELGRQAQLVHVHVLVAAVVVLVNLERTFRASVGTLRWRIKFAIIGLGLIFAARVYTSSQSLLYSTADPGLSVFDAGALLLGCVLITLSFLRASLSGVQVYPSLAVLQSSLTVLLAGAYLLAVGVLAKVVVFLGGDAAFPVKAFFVLVAIVALGLLLASDRVRILVRQFVSRHFHRPFYDYRVLWRSFTERTSSIVDEVSYARELVNLVSDAVQTLSVSVWLAQESRGRLVLAASTSLPNAPSPASPQAELDLRSIAEELARHPEPMRLEGSWEKWAEELKRRNPEQFNKGGGRICVPLTSKERLLGMLIVGDKVSGIAFSVEDTELFKCIGSQAASGLLNLQLSQQLVRAKEMEAFQTMAAFFVHDLKNTASSLSLMLQNLPAQMENPAFRQDALRAVAKALGKLNDLISRLGLLREKVQMTRVPADLNQVVRVALDAVAVGPEVQLVRLLNAPPKILIDPEQVQKVVMNLLINAREAIGAKGEIRVETSGEGSWAMLSVEDNGCGMSPEFLSRSLFRPFQTTKKNGIGIGMFHCKTIVEAHQGRIEAESEVGKGTKFRVLFPMGGINP